MGGGRRVGDKSLTGGFVLGDLPGVPGCGLLSTMASLPRFSLLLTVAVFCGGTLLPGALPQSVRAASVAPAPAAAPAPTPVQPTSFDEVAARLDKGGTFYLYLSAAQWFDGLSSHVTEWRDLALNALPKDQKNAADRRNIEKGFAALAKLIKQSGIEQITGMGASSVALEPGLNRNVVFVHHHKDAEMGLFGTAFGDKPHPLEGLDYLPADTAYAHYGDLDLSRILRTVYDTLEGSGIPEVKKGVDDALAQFQQVTGLSAEDAVGSLGGSEGILLTLDPAKKIHVSLGDDKSTDVPSDDDKPGVPPAGRSLTLPLPRLAFFLRTNDDKIFTRIDQVIGMMPGLTKVDEEGMRMRTFAFPASPDFTVRATVAQLGDFLVLTSDDGLIRDLLAAQKSGQGLKATPEFAKLAAGMPTEGNGFTVVTRQFGETVKTVQAEMMKQNPGMDAGQTAWLQKFYAGQNVGSTYTVSAHVDDGWLSVSKGAEGVNQVLLPLAIVPAAIAAGVAWPMYQAMQPKSDLTAKSDVAGEAARSKENINQIALACRIYAGDHDGKFPPTLDVLTPDLLAAPFLTSPFAPDEPTGYTYTPGLTIKSPAKDVLLTDKFAGKEHRRIVAHVDGSTEATKVP